jgi:hypothetical protein
VAGRESGDDIQPEPLDADSSTSPGSLNSSLACATSSGRIRPEIIDPAYAKTVPIAMHTTSASISSNAKRGLHHNHSAAE